MSALSQAPIGTLFTLNTHLRRSSLQRLLANQNTASRSWPTIVGGRASSTPQVKPSVLQDVALHRYIPVWALTEPLKLSESGVRFMFKYHENVCFCATDGPPFSWWVGGLGGGQVHTYWGGAPHGSRQCSCGLQQNCVDPKHQCNCDADRNEWYLIFSCIS